VKTRRKPRERSNRFFVYSVKVNISASASLEIALLTMTH
jgi:hypothetical protein